MSIEDIIRMAREAGFKKAGDAYCGLAHELERFAAIVAAAQRQWVGLTDAEISKEFHPLHQTAHEFARAIEAKLREKNGGET